MRITVFFTLAELMESSTITHGQWSRLPEYSLERLTFKIDGFLTTTAFRKSRHHCQRLKPM